MQCGYNSVTTLKENVIQKMKYAKNMIHKEHSVPEKPAVEPTC